MAQPQKPNLLTKALRTAVVPIAFAGFFSLISNLLYLALPLYINQVYARVLTSHSMATLIILTAGAGAVFLLSSVIDDLKNRILLNYGLIFDRMLASHVFTAPLEPACRPGSTAKAQALRALDSFRQVVTGSGVTVLFDIPWMPVFFGLLFYIDPWVGMATAVGGLILFLLVLWQDRVTRGTLRTSNNAALRGYAMVDSALRNGDVVRAYGMVPALGA